MRVATGFIIEHDSELGNKSDSELLEMVQEFGADKALDFAAEQAGKDILEFVNGIEHDEDANRIAVNISDLLAREDFADQVVYLVRENQYLHIA